jgi:predicted secreted protein
MRYTSLLAIIALSLALSCAAPAAAPGQPANAEMDAFIGSAAVLVADVPATIMVGGEFAVVLEGNYSTGYAWTYTAAPADLATETGKESFGPPAQPMVGEPVVTVWKFTAKAEGEMTLTYLYYRPWEKPETAVTRMSYTVKIVK